MRLAVILDNIRSAHNVGAIFRTADALGAEKIFLCGTTPKPGSLGKLGINPSASSGQAPSAHSTDAQSGEQSRTTSSGQAPSAALRASRDLTKTALGAENFVPWEYKKRAIDAVKLLKKQGFQIVALEQDKKAGDIRSYNPPAGGKITLILGYEVKGIAKNILNKCDKIIYIPMFGKKESLNVSVAFGVAGYVLKFQSEILRSIKHQISNNK